MLNDGSKGTGAFLTTVFAKVTPQKMLTFRGPARRVLVLGVAAVILAGLPRCTEGTPFT
jgi:hypothetical protein